MIIINVLAEASPAEIMRTAWTKHTIASSCLVYWSLTHRTWLSTLSQELVIKCLHSFIVIHYFSCSNFPQISRRASFPRMMLLLT